ncbi:hypothetical protein HanXRQr2_Chr16g0751421 [Helianthus annuus]|uniref:Uncharacterized protein n=1 Tax=Helianthus annuus TaxID=4232 RepID=A0A9K3DTU8_HELAN|nr:hypothetical protein HanXRQr2_Chr16g0751421 [Helianthus annuus]KAJ0821429.1 hypothetical protein HanPSC8_Chr16g0720081 [Helianthus annuus]
MIDAGVEALVPVVVGTTDRNCKEVYGKGSTAVVLEDAAEVTAKLGSGASTSNSRSRDLVTAGETGMVVTGLVSSNGLLVIIA